MKRGHREGSDKSLDALEGIIKDIDIERDTKSESLQNFKCNF